MLVLLRANASDVTKLKQLLDSFSAATGLRINFSKSIVVPMHVAHDALPALLAALSCQCEGLPQTYLGLPLSNTKLNLAAFALLISKANKYLSGWRASLLCWKVICRQQKNVSDLFENK